MAKFMAPRQKPRTPGFVFHNAEHSKREMYFTPDECDWIIEYGKNEYPEFASVGENGGEVRRETRDVYVRNIFINEKTNGLFEKMMFIADVTNQHHFDFEIAGIMHGLQLLEYTSNETKQHYDWHIDVGGGNSYGRKISMVVQLSDPSDYEGGELQVDEGKPVTMPKERGSVILFPSYMRHRVTPVTRGTRWSLVIWVQGYTHFR